MKVTINPNSTVAVKQEQVLEKLGDYIIREYWELLLKRVEEAKSDDLARLGEAGPNDYKARLAQGTLDI